MAGVRALIALAFAGCIGLTFLVLGCALVFSPFQHAYWYPLIVLVFYILSPMPLSIARRYTDDMAATSAVVEFALFMTTGIVISAFGLPLILAITGKMAWASLGFTFAGNLVIFATITAYFWLHDDDDSYSSGLF